MQNKMAVDYSLYLVTNSTKTILGDKDLAAVVLKAIEGGVSIVQYRDKTSETAELIRMGNVLHPITSKFSIPLLINDRVDVALAVGAEGVHLGQDDMGMPFCFTHGHSCCPLTKTPSAHEALRNLLTRYTDIATAQKLLGQHAIIGITCSTLDEARTAVMGGASYLGIGTVFATPTCVHLERYSLRLANVLVARKTQKPSLGSKESIQSCKICQQ